MGFDFLLVQPQVFIEKKKPRLSRYTWLYQKIRYTKNAEKPVNHRAFHAKIWYNGF